MDAPNTTLMFYFFLILVLLCCVVSMLMVLSLCFFPILCSVTSRWWPRASLSGTFTPRKEQVWHISTFPPSLPPTLAPPSDWARIFVCWEHFPVDNDMVTSVCRVRPWNPEPLTRPYTTGISANLCLVGAWIPRRQETHSYSAATWTFLLRQSWNLLNNELFNWCKCGGLNRLWPPQTSAFRCLAHREWHC